MSKLFSSTILPYLQADTPTSAQKPAQPPSPLPNKMAKSIDHQPIPVFIKLNNGESFKQMKTSVISEIIQELEKEFGTFEKGGVTIAAGGDIFIRPTSTLQQEHLLATKLVA